MPHLPVKEPEAANFCGSLCHGTDKTPTLRSLPHLQYKREVPSSSLRCQACLVKKQKPGNRLGRSAPTEKPSANAGDGPKPFSFSSPHPSILPEDLREVPAGTSPEASGQGRGEPANIRVKSGQGSENPALFREPSGQGSDSPSAEPSLQFALEKPRSDVPFPTPTPTSVTDPSHPCVIEETEGCDTAEIDPKDDEAFYA